VLRAGSWASDEPGRRLSAQINRYASDVEPLLIDYFEYWLDREPAAAGWREELRSLAIDKKNLDKGLQSRGARAVIYAIERGIGQVSSEQSTLSAGEALCQNA
jgi:hypothetical protein